MANIKQITVNGTTYDLRDDSKLSTSLKGTALGLAELDENGRVPDSQLPSSFKPLYGTTAYWNEQISFVPEPGAIIIYTDRGTVETEDGDKYVAGIKIGDGNAYVVDLPFVGDDVAQNIIGQFTAHYNDTTMHITSEERSAWNNKVDVGLYGEILEFTR